MISTEFAFAQGIIITLTILPVPFSYVTKSVWEHAHLAWYAVDTPSVFLLNYTLAVARRMSTGQSTIQLLLATPQLVILWCAVGWSFRLFVGHCPHYSALAGSLYSWAVDKKGNGSSKYPCVYTYDMKFAPFHCHLIPYYVSYIACATHKTPRGK